MARLGFMFESQLVLIYHISRYGDMNKVEEILSKVQHFLMIKTPLTGKERHVFKFHKEYLTSQITLR